MKRAAPPRQGNISPPPVKRKIDSTTTNKAVATFFKPASQKEPDKISWRVIDHSLVIGRNDPQTGPPQASQHPVKIAAFDLDDTLISATGAKFARSATSWRWWDTSVPGRLKSLHEDGYLIVIFTNQGNVSLKPDPKALKKDTLSLTNLKEQMGVILRQLDLPISVYGATAQDRYRKPRIGMWKEVLEDYDLQVDGAVDMENSFYVGDAGGRTKTDKRKKDFATTDRELAANIGIAFHTPEEFFLKADPESFSHDFHPAQHLERTSGKTSATASFAKTSPQDLVIFCGSPGAGKSSYYWKVLQPLGYERINQDTLKTVRRLKSEVERSNFQQRDKCLKKAREYLQAGDSVAVDNTNADVETRKYWIQVAQDLKIPIRLIRFTAPARLCEHNDSVRALNANLVQLNPEGRQMLPGIAFRSFVQRFQEPTLAEGFHDITVVDFEFKGSPEERAIWSRFWVSKYST